MGDPLDYVEILQLFSDEELEDEYGWHRQRGKEHRRSGRYGLYWWHQKHAEQICHEIGRRVRYDTREDGHQQLVLGSLLDRQAPPWA